MQKNLYLFDMDGTLTPHRKPIHPTMVKSLLSLMDRSEEDNHVAIVTGSDMNYIWDQCSTLLEQIDNNSLCHKFRILPCNGTKEYRVLNNSPAFECVSQKDMKQHIGEKNYYQLIRILLQCQMTAATSSALLSRFSLSGTFLQYRNSLLNWCPIGRDSTDKERMEFIEADTRSYIREQLIYELEHCFYLTDLNCLMVSLGGQTSIDICPKGWDKTQALTLYNLEEYKNIVFIGDRCKRGQNDFTIYETVKILNNGRSFEVSNYLETEKIIELTLLNCEQNE